MSAGLPIFGPLPYTAIQAGLQTERGIYVSPGSRVLYVRSTGVQTGDDQEIARRLLPLVPRWAYSTSRRLATRGTSSPRAAQAHEPRRSGRCVRWRLRKGVNRVAEKLLRLSPVNRGIRQQLRSQRQMHQRYDHGRQAQPVCQLPGRFR